MVIRRFYSVSFLNNEIRTVDHQGRTLQPNPTQIALIRDKCRRFHLTLV